MLRIYCGLSWNRECRGFAVGRYFSLAALGSRCGAVRNEEPRFDLLQREILLEYETGLSIVLEPLFAFIILVQCSRVLCSGEEPLHDLIL
ncbi:hypothetical protein PUN28_002204 [Cardiocondyla obscurior]|uniref:Uncharacterized protein n=1 Tax=Cardiocondyla obscurior TaxID=286306 RepID=A0AAW2GSV2_9HYME